MTSFAIRQLFRQSPPCAYSGTRRYIHIYWDIVKHRMSIVNERRCLAVHIPRKRHSMFYNTTLDISKLPKSYRFFWYCPNRAMRKQSWPELIHLLDALFWIHMFQALKLIFRSSFSYDGFLLWQRTGLARSAIPFPALHWCHPFSLALITHQLTPLPMTNPFTAEL